MQPANKYNIEQLRLLSEVIVEIDEWPAEVRDFRFQYELFGCWMLVVRCNGVRTRFDFDGKDRYLAALRLQRDAGDFSKRPKGLGGVALPGGLNQESLISVVQFIRTHAT
jgi:hypothetical protein